MDLNSFLRKATGTSRGGTRRGTGGMGARGAGRAGRPTTGGFGGKLRSFLNKRR